MIRTAQRRFAPMVIGIPWNPDRHQIGISDRHRWNAQAQTKKPFSHPFSPHCLRHTFAIQHLNQRVDIGVVSKWLGHKSVAVTAAHYANWIKSTKEQAEEVSKDANARMMAAMEAIGD